MTPQKAIYYKGTYEFYTALGMLEERLSQKTVLIRFLCIVYFFWSYWMRGEWKAKESVCVWTKERENSLRHFNCFCYWVFASHFKDVYSYLNWTGLETMTTLLSLSGNCIQRMRRTPPLDELQPPPYQDDSGSPHLSCTPSEIGDAKCEISHCSNSPRCSFNKCPSEGSTGHEAESYHNKGYEDDVPSDSTAVLSPEVSRSAAVVAKESSEVKSLRLPMTVPVLQCLIPCSFSYLI